MVDELSKNIIISCLHDRKMTGDIIILEETDSTNSVLKELAMTGAPEGTVVIADKQSAGRGRLGRSFFSPEGAGIYMSVLLRPQIELQKSVRITSMAAVAVACAMEKESGLFAQIKWVNDVFLNAKKVCGILAEAGFTPEGALDYVVLGIGVNVGRMEFPDELKEIATSVNNECGYEKVSRNELIAAILNEIEAWYPTIKDGSFIEENRRHSILLGRDILVLGTDGNASYKAKAVDLDDMGHLIIERNGKREELNSGEVSIRL